MTAEETGADVHRRAAALIYLSDWLADEDYWTPVDPSSAAWFKTLAEYVDSLSVWDDRLALAERYLQPFLDADERVDAALYPDGFAIAYVERTMPGGPPEPYLDGFLKALARDHAAWVLAVVLDGQKAEWTLDHNPLDDPRINRRGRWTYGPFDPDGGRIVTFVRAPRCGAKLSGGTPGNHCAKVVGHSGHHQSLTAKRAAYDRSLAKRYPSGLTALVTRGH